MRESESECMKMKIVRHKHRLTNCVQLNYVLEINQEMLLAQNLLVGHLFQSYDTIYVRFFATYTCVLYCFVRFLFPSI